MIGMALRVRCVAWGEVCWKEVDWKVLVVGGSRKDDEGWSWCWSGDCSGEPLERELRSEPDEWMDCSCAARKYGCTVYAKAVCLHDFIQCLETWKSGGSGHD
jgi:hypothetical protein